MAPVRNLSYIVDRVCTRDTFANGVRSPAGAGTRQRQQRPDTGGSYKRRESEAMTRREIPSDHDVVDALLHLNGHSTALALCNELVARGNTRRDSQLAIQRASERGRVVTANDWTLSVAQQAAAA